MNEITRHPQTTPTLGWVSSRGIGGRREIMTAWTLTKAALATLAVLGIPMALVYVAGAWIESLRGAVL